MTDAYILSGEFHGSCRFIFYEKCNGPLVGTYNIWPEVSLKFLR